MSHSVFSQLRYIIMNAYLIPLCDFTLPCSPQVRFVGSSPTTSYLSPTSFPPLLNLGPRVPNLGKSGMMYNAKI
jgi:hypothetical protein